MFIDDKSEIEKIIKGCRTCFLGISDEQNQPYVIPMNFGFYNNEIYLHSGQFGRKWEILKKNPKACITFCLGDELAYQDEHIACSWRVKSKSVIAEGIIEFIDDFDEKVKAMNITMGQYSEKTFTYSSPAIKNVGVFKMKIEKIVAKQFGEKAKTPWNS